MLLLLMLLLLRPTPLASAPPTAPAIELPSPAGGFVFDAVVLEEDMRRANQRIAGYTLEACTKAGDKCSDGDWAAITQSATGWGQAAPPGHERANRPC